MKFGGSSLGTPELREIAVARVLEVRARGTAPVVVCSALGRAPEPYATDSLIALLGPARGGPNRDLLLACGELIAAAVFAELLTAAGARAQAMTGSQAGIVTDDAFGDARILRVDTANVIAALERRRHPGRRRFPRRDGRRRDHDAGPRRQRPDRDRARGRARLGAGRDLHRRERRDVVGSAPRRRRAHDRSRVVERDGRARRRGREGDAPQGRRAGTCVAHRPTRSRACRATSARRSTTRSAPIRSARSPASPRAARSRSCASRFRGDSDDGKRARDHAVLFGRLADRGVSIDMINVNDAGDLLRDRRGAARRRPARTPAPGTALRVRPHCAEISIVGVGMRGTPGVMYRVVRALDGAGVEIIHSTD